MENDFLSVRHACNCIDELNDNLIERLSENMETEQRNAFIKVCKCIRSCEKYEHLLPASNMVIIYQDKYGRSDYLKRQYFNKSNQLKNLCPI
jgi:hypothetical protein